MPQQRPPRGRRGDYRTFVPVTSRWSDNDMFGHLNNAAYLSYFDTAVTTWLFRSDLAADESRIFYVVETGCRYHSEVRFPDRIEVGLRIARLGSSSVAYEIGIFRNDEDEAAAEGIFVHVHVDAATRRPKPLDEAARAILSGIALEGDER